MNDIVSIRKIRPGAKELSSMQAVEAACEGFGEETDRLLEPSLSDAARVLAIDDLERGDNRSSLAARIGPGSQMSSNLLAIWRCRTLC